MSSPFSISLSGLQAESSRLHATAHNLANANTDGFKAHRVVSRASGSAGMGVETELQIDDRPGYEVVDASGEPISELSNVDFAFEALTSLRAKHAYEANLAALRVLSEVEDSTLQLLE